MELGEHDKYVAMWSIDAYRTHSPGERYLDEAIQKLSPTIIDFGCGTGRATAKLAELGYKVLGIDFAENCLDKNIDVPFLLADLTELPAVYADYGYCCDVMEHIPTDSVDKVLTGIAKSVRAAVFFSIALQTDGAGRFIGQRLHLTVQTPEWWREKLREHFPIVECYERSGSLFAICQTK